MAEQDDVEQVHCVIDKVYVFQVPKASSVASGYRASDWPKTALWSGRLRVVSRGGKCSVLLENTDSEGVFAVCHYTQKSAVEQANDSSRYFVLRIVNEGGQKALLGLGFKERSHAFEFKVALQDFENLKNADKRADEYLSQLPSKDFSIPEGQQITIAVPKIGGKKEEGGAKVKKKKKAEGEGGLLKLAPPPEGKSRQPAIKKSSEPSKPAASSGGDFGFDALSLDDAPKAAPVGRVPAAAAPKPAPAPAAAPKPAAAAAALNPFDDLFG